MQFTCKILESVTEIPAANWSTLKQYPAHTQSPFLSFEFLSLLETTQCIGAQTGWLSHHIGIFDDSECIAFIPCFEKHHSYGEYVFDHSWADAYHQHNLAYYPKLVSAIPFTPVTASKIMLNAEYPYETIICTALDFISELMKKGTFSSMHWLFTDSAFASLLSNPKPECLVSVRGASEAVRHSNEEAIHNVNTIEKSNNYAVRKSVQFVWNNNRYRNFDHFMEQMTSRKRRSINKERRKIAEQQVIVKRLVGNEITPDIMATFIQCYQQTYMKRSGHSGYLTDAFFHQLPNAMIDNMMIVLAYKNDDAIAGSLFFFNKHSLYGRYWGALADVDGLHFECCYYQGIEFAIANNIQIFNPGTQGEHKIMRGFAPTTCYSNHLLAHTEFHHAVLNFVKQESLMIEKYKQDAEALLPFKQTL